MTQESPADWEFSIVLPLGAIATQLQKIEAQLRLLNIKAVNLAGGRDGHPIQAIVEGRLEQIGETLHSVASLVSDIQADVSPRWAKVTHLTVDEENLDAPADRKRDDRRPSRDAGRSNGSGRKPYPEQDD
jgi:hypothetical protein